MSHTIADLKKHIFFELLDLAGRVFILVEYSDAVLIGERGFLREEREEGLLLVFNRAMDFAWNNEGISASLGFGAKTEKCFIPPDSIISVFSPDLHAQFSMSPAAQVGGKGKRTEKKGRALSKKNVITVDFNKKK